MIWEGEEISCENCGKTITVTEDEPAPSTWMSMSYVTYDGEEMVDLFCSYECLEKWITLTEIERILQNEKFELNEELKKALKTTKEYVKDVKY